jgi:THO complex subunit 2
MTELSYGNLSQRGSGVGSVALENIQSLIGCFNLDPNRVLDVILESFENSGTHMHGTFIELLRDYKAEEDTVCQIVGFKYQSLHQQQVAQQQKQLQSIKDQQTGSSKDKAGSNNNLNELLLANSDLLLMNANSLEKINLNSLYTVTAYLLKFKIVDLDLLLPHVRIY